MGGTVAVASTGGSKVIRMAVAVGMLTVTVGKAGSAVGVTGSTGVATGMTIAVAGSTGVAMGMTVAVAGSTGAPTGTDVEPIVPTVGMTTTVLTGSAAVTAVGIPGGGAGVRTDAATVGESRGASDGTTGVTSGRATGGLLPPSGSPIVGIAVGIARVMVVGTALTLVGRGVGVLVGRGVGVLVMVGVRVALDVGLALGHGVLVGRGVRVAVGVRVRVALGRGVGGKLNATVVAVAWAPWESSLGLAVPVAVATTATWRRG